MSRQTHLESNTKIVVDAPRRNYFLHTLIFHLSLRIPNYSVEEGLRNVPLLGVDRFHCKRTLVNSE
jgi:hypothetical protein